MAITRNTLASASSPYLRQHQDNPVHWQVWGAEALAAAAAANKPILLSIGYAACHWCHVMAHESFEDAEVAALMNRHFVNIKVDREERPDIDQIYMTALHAMGEQGGWPLTMVLTPAGAPFWGGTYFPPTPRFGRPSFTQVLQALARAWETERPRIDHTVASMNRALAANFAARPGNPPGPDTLDAVRHRFLAGMDWTSGGMGSAPKFPNAPVFRFLWQEAFRTGDAQAIRAVDLLLARMGQGGIYDHLGGGFARYATDDRWLIPHFEKMLYDNALILDLLALAHARAPNPLYAARARETLAWLQRDMAVAGAFAASEDADSEGVEGKFYVWTRAEIAALLGDETPFFAAHYDLPEAGNWEGHIILERISDIADPATETRIEACRQTLFQARSRRIRPGRDEKILADWNALMIAALIRAAAVFAEPAWLHTAEAVFDWLQEHLGQPDGRIAHAWREGTISAAGLLEDQAAMLRAALALYEATGEPRRLNQALRLLAAAETNFADDAGAFFMAASDAADLPVARSRNVTDGPTPSGIGMMAENYASLHHLTGDAAYRAKAEAVLAAFGGRPDMLAGSPVLLAAADLLENASCVVLTGGGAALRITGGAPALHAAALAAWDPAVVVLPLAPGAAAPPGHPAHGKTGGPPAAFVCRAGTCALPVHDPAALRALLRPAP
jgi:uncharacterized protein YyaL (SSP411 family)